MSATMLRADQRDFLQRQRIAHFASADAAGQPHVVPVCFAVIANAVYFSIDEKPKRDHRTPLKRVKNITVNPQVSIVVDHYEENWQQLAWVMLCGRAQVLHDGDEHHQAQRVLIDRYPQLKAMTIDHLAVIKTQITKVTSWGAL